jgi:hypothetical protein
VTSSTPASALIHLAHPPTLDAATRTVRVHIYMVRSDCRLTVCACGRVHCAFLFLAATNDQAAGAEPTRLPHACLHSTACCLSFLKWQTSLMIDLGTLPLMRTLHSLQASSASGPVVSD